MYKVIIAGGRDFDDYTLLAQSCDAELSAIEKIIDVEIVSGGAKGADSLGEKYAAQHSLSVKVFPADWNKYGKRAGYIRNEQMAKYANCLIAFWDGKSRGTKHMIDLANKHSLHICIVKYERNDYAKIL